MPKMFFSDGGVDLPRTKLKDKIPPHVSPRTGMAQTKKFFGQLRIPFAASGLGGFEELPDGEVAGMGRHQVEESSFCFGVSKGAQGSEPFRGEMHRLEPQDRSGQIQVIPDAAEPVGFAPAGVDLKACAGFLREALRTIMGGSHREVDALNLAVVFLGVLDPQVRNRNLP